MYFTSREKGRERGGERGGREREREGESGRERERETFDPFEPRRNMFEELSEFTSWIPAVDTLSGSKASFDVDTLTLLSSRDRKF